jgi:hypothetical protein
MLKNKKAKIAKEALIVLVIVVFTSAAVFALVKAGIVEVDDNYQESMLNTEFIPYERAGNIIIQNFRFCDLASSISGCLYEKNKFVIGEQVHFFFDVVSTTYHGQILLAENYRIIGPENKILLEVDQKNDYNYDLKSNEEEQRVFFSDYFVLEEGDPLGEYKLQLIIKNPLLDKEVRLIETMKVIE